MNNQWKAFLGVVLIFILGCLCGALGASLFFAHRATEILQRTPEKMADALERRITRGLALDAHQKQLIHLYILQNMVKRKELQLQVQPDIQFLNEQTFGQIEILLNPEQQSQFQENIAQLRKRFTRGGFNSGGPKPALPPPAAPPGGSKPPPGH